ncbi:hypothetical protein ABEQ41_24495 [Priestia megaterium]
MNEIKEKIINRTDLHFFRYCQGQYGINRGVYNTIEQWFYNKRVYNIESRRQYILDFLKYVFGDKKGSGKFGKEGLISNLQQFWASLNENLNGS